MHVLDDDGQPPSRRDEKRISGPLMDRIDTHSDIEVPPVDYETPSAVSDERLGEPSAHIRARVEAARQVPSKLDSRRSQRRRFEGTSLACRRSPHGGNADTPALPGTCVRGKCAQMQVWARPGCASTARSTVRQAHGRPGGQGAAARGDTCTCSVGVSARAYHRILKLARTIADLATAGGTGAVPIQATHVAEAIQYRPRRQF